LSESIHDVEYKRAMEHAYRRLPSHDLLSTIEVRPDDLANFFSLCERYGQTPSAMFHTLIRNNV